ncbi:sensor histidine kinase [Winogradskyella immobilis]|uniref:Histidine kinase n=1 Tax=Winogradskyella immobilis TaxID=2816852 RepID=A0ABS8EJI1_9FLAO|nr:histidine kinase [Winogradskyella immobilis]MCC1483349.1 histidine kinase [Winogradskyella immobilis]MCG0015443.1 histidine kinase [Winogradskyella immobilis]
MNKRLKNAFIYALVISGSINLGGYLVNISLESLEDAIANFKEIGIFTIALFFVPCFISVILFKSPQKYSFKQVLKSIGIIFLLSFIITYVFAWIQFSIDKRGMSLSLFNDVFLFNGTISGIISVISYLIYSLLTNKRKQKQDFMIIEFKDILLPWMIISLIYLGIYSFFNYQLVESSFSIIIFSLGLLSVSIVYYAIVLSYKKEYNSYVIFGITYFINVIVLPFIGFRFLILSSDFSNIIKMIQGTVLIGPYLLLLTLTIHVYNIYFNNKAEKESLKQIGLEASLKYQQLKTQIAPHFLFNNISVLTGLIEENQEKAVLFSENLAVIYRYFLDQEAKDLVTLKEELSFADTYLDLLKVRFENAIVVKNTINATEHFYIIPMALQQIVENIIKHNILSIEMPIEIDLSIEENYIVISNTRVSKNDSNAKKPSGLDNIKQRYTYFTDKEVIIKQDDAHFTIKLPLLNPEL